MDRDTRSMRGDGPFLFAQVTNGIGVRDIADEVLRCWRQLPGSSSRGVDV